jgi:cell division protein FtsQ
VTISAPADKRFRRPNVRPAPRRGVTGLLHWSALRGLALVLALALAAYYGAGLALGAELFRVRGVTVRGNSRLSTGEVLALVSGLTSENVLKTDLSAYRARLIDSPWVADARLRRVLPSSVEILIRERQPMGLCRLAGRLYLVDETGTVIDEYGPQYADLDLPIIDGLSGAPREGAPALDPQRAELAAAVMRDITAHKAIGRRVSQIDVSDAHDAVVILDGDTALLHLGDERFAERLRSYLELAPTLRSRLPEIDYVDLRFDERVYVRPAGGKRKKER